LVYVNRTRPHVIGRTWDLYVGISRLCRRLSADVCFTLGDIGPIEAGAPHVILLHQPYLSCNREVWNALPIWERLKFRYLRWHFGRCARKAACVLVQTSVMADRVVTLFGVPRERVHVIPSTLPEHVSAEKIRGTQPDPRLRAHPGSAALLFLAAYYAHKNHAILPELVAELRCRGLAGKVHFFLTLSGNRGRREKALLKTLARDSDFVTNLGSLRTSEVMSALMAADALFLPTLAETFGLIYVEAMATGVPILTSDRDFARWICGGLARYFDPTNPVSIADTIESFLECRTQGDYVARARERLLFFPATWEAVARQYLNILSAMA
jgi:glycosyltransferase involved in cell wall biosynthesis